MIDPTKNNFVNSSRMCWQINGKNKKNQLREQFSTRDPTKSNFVNIFCVMYLYDSIFI